MDDDTELGPNQPAVQLFFADLSRLSDGELLRLAAFGDRSADSEHRAMYAAVGRRVKAAGRRRAIEAGRALLSRWVGWRKDLAVPGYMFSVDTITSDARRQALPAAYDAMVAHVARDLLTSEQFDFLTAPWRELATERGT